MSEDHYFSADPAVPFTRQPVVATVWGRSLSLTSGSGVFARGRLDIGTAVLFRETEPPASGRVLDLGCGYGVIGLAIAVCSPATTVTGIDVNERAVLLANENAASLGVDDRYAAVTPDAVLDGRLAEAGRKAGRSWATRRTTRSGRTRPSGSARRRCTSCSWSGWPGWRPGVER